MIMAQVKEATITPRTNDLALREDPIGAEPPTFIYMSLIFLRFEVIFLTGRLGCYTALQQTVGRCGQPATQVVGRQQSYKEEATVLYFPMYFVVLNSVIYPPQLN